MAFFCVMILILFELNSKWFKNEVGFSSQIVHFFYDSELIK